MDEFISGKGGGRVEMDGEQGGKLQRSLVSVSMRLRFLLLLVEWLLMKGLCLLVSCLLLI